MKKIKWFLILINLAALLIYFNFSVYNKEEILKSDEVILIRLAPVDPRSLMQGDYMVLRYDLDEGLNRDNLPKRGFCVVKLDKNNVAEVVRFQNESVPLNSDERIIKYTAPDTWNINIGAESYFFQEGEGDKYEKGKYGGIKTDKNGNSVLVGLYGEDLKLIK